MRKTLILLSVLAIVAIGLTGCGMGEDAHYDITVKNDAWLFGTCEIYLDGNFQFLLEVGESNVIEQVIGGEHTLLAQNREHDVIAGQTFNLVSSIKWSLTDDFSLYRLFD